MDTMDSLVTLAAAIGLHRAYNHEAIFAWLRRRLDFKPFSCPPCNAFWCGMLVLALRQCGDASSGDASLLCAGLLYALALYPGVRVAMWVTAAAAPLRQYLHVLASQPVRVEAPKPGERLHVSKTTDGRVEQRLEKLDTIPSPSAAAPTPACTTCGERKASARQDLERRTDAARKATRRVVVMTALTDFAPSYSLTSVILDHARMLARDPSLYVEVWVVQTCKLDGWPTDMPSNVVLRPCLPAVPLRPDTADEKFVKVATDAMRRELMPLGNAVVMTHDLLFVEWFTVLAAAIHALGDLRGFAWLHVCHSAPSLRPATLTPPAIYRYTLPAGAHYLIALTPSHVDALAAYYATTSDRIFVLPNPRDPITMTGLDRRLRDFVQEHHLLDAEVLQVYPASTTRFDAKGLPRLIRLFAALQRRGTRATLVVANPHANGEKGAAIVAAAKRTATDLCPHPERIIFTSDAFPDLAANGLPHTWVQHLFSFSNLFAFPTWSEASSLVLCEAALHRCTLLLNSSVAALRDVFGNGHGEHGVLWHSWGTTASDDAGQDSYDRLAEDVAAAVAKDRGWRVRRAVLQRHSLDVLAPQLAAIVSKAADALKRSA